MAQLLVRLLAERLVRIPELGIFDLPYSIDVKGMPSKAVEALTKYGPYCAPSITLHHTQNNRVTAIAVDTVYLASDISSWKPLIEAAIARRRG